MIKRPLIGKSSYTDLQRLISNTPHAVLVIGDQAVNNDLVANWFAHQVTDSLNILKFGSDGFKIDDVREISRISRTKNKKAGHKRVIQIIDFQNARVEAQNALLKVLEQPVMGLVFVISSSNSSKILDTIKSRTANVHLTTPSFAEYQEYYTKATSSQLKTAFAATAGDMSLIDDYLRDNDDALELAKQVLSSDVYQRLGYIGRLTSDKNLFIGVISYIKNILVYKLEANPSAIYLYSPKIKLCTELLDQSNVNANKKLMLLKLLINL